MKRIQNMDKGQGRCVWTPQEDEALRESALRHKGEYWNLVAEDVKVHAASESLVKTAKQCRERWNNQVNPVITSRPLSDDEVNKLYSLHKVFGNRWSKISCQIPGRTDNIVKNFFLCRLRKVLRCVKKGTLKSTLPMDERECFHMLYLLGYLYKFYISPARSENIKKSLNSQTKRRKNNGDQYINQMINDQDITAAKIGSFVKMIINSTNFSINKPGLQEYKYLIDLKGEYNSDSNSLLNASQHPDLKTDPPTASLCILELKF
eukprot:TRINITY_DN7157_c0_g1_i5.p1 TRINITY_DN7157_c0_g1~~TRINITY_DN7157_c0_g1_i5.p1  ORF type:complete len:263 (+),score=35.64 TRINITY_DN7157_c0_g1_i5:260-1048(+)